MTRRAHLIVVTAISALALRSGLALSQPLRDPAPTTVPLEVTRDARSESCPDLARVRALLLARLERDAVSDDATRHASLRFTRSAARFEALLYIRGPLGHVSSRRLRSSATDCARLGDAATLVLALAIDPLRALRRPPPGGAVVPSPPVEPSPAAPPPIAPRPPPVLPVSVPAPLTAPLAQALPPAVPSASRPLRVDSSPRSVWQLAALATANFGVAPGIVADALRPGLSLRFALVRARLMIPVELGLDAPGRFEDARVAAAVWGVPLSVGVGVCVRSGSGLVLFGCATLAAGAVFAWGSGFANDRDDVAFSFALGARAGLEAPLSTRWRFVASLDLRGLLLRPVLALGEPPGETLWTSPPVSASLAVGVAWMNL